MSFVKLDCCILNSTLWVDHVARDVFITALLMAEPYELAESVPQLGVESMDTTGFVVPPGWYGFVPSSGIIIISRAMVNIAEGKEALKRLGEPEAESRTAAHAGRRMVRVDGGYIVLNFMLYRDRDHKAALRMRRLRARKTAEPVTEDRREKDPLVTPSSQCYGEQTVTNDDVRRTPPACDAVGVTVTQAECRVQSAEAESLIPPVHLFPPIEEEPSPSAHALAFARFWKAYPKKTGKADALNSWTKKVKPALAEAVIAAVEKQKKWTDWTREDGRYIPNPATWLNQGRWDDEERKPSQADGIEPWDVVKARMLKNG